MTILETHSLLFGARTLQGDRVMSEMTAETLFNQTSALPVSEQLKLRALLAAQLKHLAETTNGVKFVEPIPVPDPEPNRRWMNEHAHEYAG